MDTSLTQLYLPEGAIDPQDVQSVDISSPRSDVMRGRLDNCNISIRRIRPRPDQIPCFGRPRLEHAANQWRRASHPNIQSFIGFLDHPSWTFPMVVTLHTRWNVLDYLDANPNADKYVLVSYVALALKYMHNQNPPILHGNIKGSNILVDNARKVYLSDIGIHEALSEPGRVGLGVRWKAPEKINNQPHSAACDVWSFGMTLLEVFTCVQPFREIAHEATVLMAVSQGGTPARPPKNLIPDDDLWQLLELCWGHLPDQRPQMTFIVPRLRYLKEVTRITKAKSN